MSGFDLGELAEAYPHGYSLSIYVTPNPPPAGGYLLWRLGPISDRVTGETMSIIIGGRSPMSVQLRDTQQVDLTVRAVDAAGNPVAADQAGSFTWSVSDESIATLVDNGDPMSRTLVTTGSLGTVTVSVSDDTDGDPATAEFMGSLAVDVVAGPVSQIVIEAGTPVDRP